MKTGACPVKIPGFLSYFLLSITENNTKCLQISRDEPFKVSIGTFIALPKSEYVPPCCCFPYRSLTLTRFLFGVSHS